MSNYGGASRVSFVIFGMRCEQDDGALGVGHNMMFIDGLPGNSCLLHFSIRWRLGGA